MASAPRTFDRDTNTWRDGEATFLDCSCWRHLVENVAGSLSKGSRVVVAGRCGPTGEKPRKEKNAPAWPWTPPTSGPP
ncbi:single-stranded DNA-binding protein [Streptomyces sp. NBC_00233]|uniref:single-stranded DNA-binding protein n=1 Tax=Streptomyces sp. NBC_00233 TaxID=2975686 RepID=UPI00338D7043